MPSKNAGHRTDAGFRYSGFNAVVYPTTLINLLDTCMWLVAYLCVDTYMWAGGCVCVAGDTYLRLVDICVWLVETYLWLALVNTHL